MKRKNKENIVSWKERKVGEYDACEICGKRILINSSRQKYCPECAQAMRKTASLRGRDKARAELMAVRRGLDLDKYKGTNKECRYKKSCVYGGQKNCEYMAITGKSRLLAGYPIVDGKCGAYKRGGKPRRVNLKLDTSAPVLPPGKLNEI